MPDGLNILTWIVIGLLAGAIAGWFVPGHERNGCIGTTAIGVAGGLLGGWLWTNLLGQDPATGFLGALLIAVLGAAIVIFALRAVRGGA